MKNSEVSSQIEESLEMLRALNEEGLVVAPTTPTDEMISAAKSIANLTDDEIRKLYFSMITFAADDAAVPMATN